MDRPTEALLLGAAVGAFAGIWYSGLRRDDHDKRRAPAPATPVMGASMLAGKVAIVTGASSGIGREIALLFAAHGAKVLVLDITDVPLEGGLGPVDRWAEIRDGPGEVIFMRGDTTSSQSCGAAVAEVVKRWGQLDIWVNNAAIGMGGDVLSTKEDDWDKVIAVNAKGYWLGAQAAVRQMLKQEVAGPAEVRGKVINISSQHGMVCCPGDIAYGVGKAAAVYMTKQIAVDFAKRNITCNAVAPGKIVTGCDSDVRQYSLDRTPCPRLGRPRDVASAVLYLASDMCGNFVTGQNLLVDGGWMAF